MGTRTRHALVRPGQPAAAAIPQLVREHGDRIYALILRMCGSREDAEDLVQETFLRAYRKWDQFEGRSSPTTWLYTIALRLCRRMHRRRAGAPPRIESLQDLLPFGEPRIAALPGETEDALSRRVRDEARERIEAAIAALPAAFRLPLVLKDIIDLPVSDVAAVLGVKPATVKSRVHRARLRIRKQLLGALPKKSAPPPAYPLSMCLDLLEAKQEALDRGVPFPIKDAIICERCRSICATLDLAVDLCHELASPAAPRAIRDRILRCIKDLQGNGRS